jgi:hypothetical protein
MSPPNVLPLKIKIGNGHVEFYMSMRKKKMSRRRAFPSLHFLKPLLM